MTLLTAVQEACGELALQQPSAVIGNTDPQVIQLLSLATREAKEFAAQGGQWSGWPELRKEYTFSLVPATGGTAGVYVGNTTNGSATITGIADTTGILAGYGVSGGSILTGAIVQSLTATTVTLNTPANSTTTGQNFSFGKITYDLPTDIQMFITATQWDRNFRWQMLGPISAQEWQTIVSGICPVGPRIRFRVMADSTGVDKFWIQPPPGVAQTDTIAYEYISKNFCNSALLVGQSAWTADTDTYLWPEDTLVLGLIWRFKRAKGLDYGEEMQMYERAVDRQIARSGGNRQLPMNAHSNGLRLLNQSNVPDTGFGT
jgi:hypothetical protein